MDAAYDYIIVGAGSAGCVLANRLSANPNTRVLLLEAGGRDVNLMIHIPAGFTKAKDNPKLNWGFEAETDPELHGRRLPLPRGKGLGGSSSINGMVYVRGQANDYDTWAQMGNRGWDWEGVLPFFVKSENREGATDDMPWRGRGGELNVADVATTYPILDRVLKAAQQAGYNRNPDYNSGDQEGWSYYQVTQKNGRRWSSAQAFLRPAERRRNLRILTHATVTRLTLDGSRITGVEYQRRGRIHRAQAGREVVLSAGGLQSPKLLELSGIGNSDILARRGIRTRHALPGVGENYRDHLMVGLVFRTKGVRSLNQQTRGLNLVKEVIRYAVTRTGVLASSAGVVNGFVRSRPELDLPDLQMRALHASYRDMSHHVLDAFPAMTIAHNQSRPESRGSVHLTSSDPLAHPSVRPNFLSADIDRRVVVDGLRIVRKLAAQPALAPYLEAELPDTADARTDAELLEIARETSSTIYHGVGTCKMGHDPMAVVDDRLRVRGLIGLRVVDASIMPTLTSGNTNAPAIMIGEKGAAMILEDA